MTPGQIVGIVFGIACLLLGIYLVMKYKAKPYHRKQRENVQKQLFDDEVDAIEESADSEDESEDSEDELKRKDRI